MHYQKVNRIDKEIKMKKKNFYTRRQGGQRVQERKKGKELSKRN
jgi:hypothetical protein